MVNKERGPKYVAWSRATQDAETEDAEFNVNVIYTQASLSYKARSCQRKSEEGRGRRRKDGGGKGRKRKHSAPGLQS